MGGEWEVGAVEDERGGLSKWACTYICYIYTYIHIYIYLEEAGR